MELVVALDRTDIEQDLRRAAKRLAEHIDVPGFRKGAAPYDIVSRHIGGEARVYEEALQSIAGRTLESIIRERNLEVAVQPDISIQKMVPPFGVSYKAVMSLLPSVQLGDVSNIKLKRNDVRATDEDVEKVINNLREMYAKEAAVDRPAQQGDRVILDLEVKRGGVPIENGTSKDFPLILGEGRFIPGFEEHVVGLKAGDKKSFELTFPEQYYEKSLAGKPAQFSVLVKQVFLRALPAAGDAFAKDLGHAQTAEELRKQIRESLQYEKEYTERERFEMACMDELVKRSQISELAEPLIVGEAQKMLAELEQSVAQQGANFDDYLASIKRSREDLGREFRPKAEHRLKVSLVGREFGRKWNVSASDDEVKQELAVAKKAHQNQPELLVRLESREYREHIRNILVSRKIFQRLAEKVSA